jgi:hypothetical protein
MGLLLRFVKAAKSWESLGMHDAGKETLRMHRTLHREPRFKGWIMKSSHA